MKRAVAALLALMLLLAGCAKKQETQSTIPLKYGSYDIPSAEPKWVTLYYEDNGRVLAFPQQLNIGDGSVYSSVLDALLSGTKEGYKSAFDDGVQARSIMLLQNVIYIDLSAAFGNMPAERIFACLSVMAATFCAFSGVDFINVTVEGKQLVAPQSGRPVTLLSSRSGSPAELAARFSSAAPQAENIYACIFDTDETGAYLIPRAVSVTVTGGDYASALIKALLSEGGNLFAGGFSVLSKPEIENETLKVTLLAPSGWVKQDIRPGANAMLNTLSCAFPDAKNLHLEITDKEGKLIDSSEVSATDSFNGVRGRVQITVPGPGGKLCRGQMLIQPAADSDELKNFVQSYITSAASALAGTATVNAVAVRNDTVIIDLTGEYFDFYSDLDSSDEYATVYALVTTVCSYSGTKKAMILQDHQMRSTFSGNIALSEPLLTLPEKFTEALT